MKILIDNGHGENTPGKRSPVWADGQQLFEYEFNRDIASRVYNALRGRGVDCELLVRESADVSLAERVRRANEAAGEVGAANCLLISIHANAGGGTGWEAWTSVGQTRSDDYAEIFYRTAKKVLPPEFPIRSDFADGDSDKESQFYILRKTVCPAVLTENLFMDTERDCRYLMSASGRGNIAKLHIDAIMECIGS